jgi:predicted ATPase
MQANLVDVGYGVSQVLPVLVDIALADKDSTLLLQQPEVHLHPRAQAQLGTYFVRAVELGVNLVVETHSDQILDRVRMEVRDAARGKKKKGIQPEQVLILYFERTDEGVKVHPITIGKDGGLVGVPEGYRDFFLREEARFLGVDDVSDR